MGDPLWTPVPQQVPLTLIDQFRQTVNATRDLRLVDTRKLHAWSVAEPLDFWRSVWDHCGVVGDAGHPPSEVPQLPDASLFPSASLNVVDTYLAGRPDRSEPAIISLSEGQDRRVLTWEQLETTVASVARAMRASGVGRGDRVSAWLPNIPETVIVFLAAASIGAVFSSTSPDFGPEGVADRFGQIEPVMLVAADGYTYGGRRFDTAERLAEIVEKLPSVRTVVMVRHLGTNANPRAAATARGLEGLVEWHDFVATGGPGPLVTQALGFDDPGLILFSSGTTGRPKCIIHRAAGVLLKHLSEHQLHCDVRPGDRVLYFTTCGWMMWNWLVGALASRATIVLYDGNPLYPSHSALFDIVDRYAVTLLGVSAKFIDSLRKARVSPMTSHRLSSLRTLCSTGSPLVAESFDFVYEHIKRDVHLASISGGTDLCGCFVAGDPTLPVYAGEIQGPALGMDVAVFDEAGAPLGPDITGELVCRHTFPSVPLGFWGDEDGSRLRHAYFERYPGVWTHGDFASWTDHGGMIIVGRSDATLNAGGVRIGTAEIYRIVEGFDEVAEAVAIGQAWEDDTRVILFVRMNDGDDLDDTIRARIATALRTLASPRHVPAVIAEVNDIPRTRSGKITELAVSDVVNGRSVRNVDALANPEALDQFRDHEDL